MLSEDIESDESLCLIYFGPYKQDTHNNGHKFIHLSTGSPVLT